MLAIGFLGLDYSFFGFGFGLFSFADTKMRRKEGVWKFFRQRGGFARRTKALHDEGIPTSMAAGGGPFVKQKKAAPSGAAAKILSGPTTIFFQASKGN
jgi:hypothetical protein